MPAGQLSARLRRTGTENIRNDAQEVPFQVMVPAGVRRQPAIMGAQRGESLRRVVLRALGAIGIKIAPSRLVDRRGRRRREINGTV
jgi:hypothetical protein